MIKQLNRVHPLSRGLRGAWMLNEFSGRGAINSVTGQSGLLKGTAAFGLGNKGSCVNFTGTANEVVSIGTGILDISKPLSFSCWVNIATIASFPVIFGCRIAELSPYMIFLHRTDRSGICLQVGPGGGATLTAAPSKNLTVGVWAHVGFTWNQESQRAKLYQDGVKIYDASFVIGAWGGSTTDETYGIGAYNDNGLALNFNGSINQCFAWQRELSDADMALMYAQPEIMFNQINISSLYKARNQNNFFRMFN
jgi:hypothetical protein